MEAVSLPHSVGGQAHTVLSCGRAQYKFAGTFPSAMSLHVHKAKEENV